MQYEDRLTIATPEGVELELTLAGLGSRLAAALLDTLIKYGVMLAVLLFFGGLSALSESTSEAQDIFLLPLIILTFFVLMFGYDIFFEAFASGRTPGKAALGIRVVREGGRPCGFLAATIRNLVRVVDFLPASYLVGMISVLVTAKNQRVGDLAAGTIVVRDRKMPKNPPPVGATVPPSPQVAGWDVSAITSDELTAVRSFLARRFELDPEARYRLGWELAARLRPKVGGADPSHPELFLEQLAAAKSARM